MTARLFVMCIGVGTMVGLTGMGAAALLTPLLIVVGGVTSSAAVGTDLVCSVVTKLIGAAVHLRQGTVDVLVVRRLALGSIPGGVASAGLVMIFPRSSRAEYYARCVISLLLVAFALLQCWRVALPVNADGGERRPWLSDGAMPFWGFLVGSCVGLTSIGSGTMLNPLLTVRYGGRPAVAVGTDMAHAALLVGGTGLVYAASGRVEWSLVPIVLAGALPGVVMGSWLAGRVPPRCLRLVLAAVLLVAGWKMLTSIS
jgi:hypothetical protein